MSEQEALATVREMIDEGRSFVLATVDERGRPRMRWMGALARDPEHEHTCYMECAAGSRKVGELSGNPAAQLLFTSDDYRCIATMDGVAGLVDDLEVKRMVYEAIPASPKFFSSPEDPNLGVIRFQTTAIEVVCMGKGGPVHIDLT